MGTSGVAFDIVRRDAKIWVVSGNGRWSWQVWSGVANRPTPACLVNWIWLRKCRPSPSVALQPVGRCSFRPSASRPSRRQLAEICSFGAAGGTSCWGGGLCLPPRLFSCAFRYDCILFLLYCPKESFLLALTYGSDAPLPASMFEHVTSDLSGLGECFRLINLIQRKRQFSISPFY